MPLPNAGELVLRPNAHSWQTSGEVCGVKITEEVHASLKDAFACIERAMERDGGVILAAASAEQQCPGTGTTPLQAALLANLLGTSEAAAVNSRDEAQALIDSMYRCEYSPLATAEHRRNEKYAELLMQRFSLDRDGIQESRDRDGGS